MNFSSSKVAVMATTLFMFLCTYISIAQPSDGTTKPVTNHNWASQPMGTPEVGPPPGSICVRLQEGNILHLNLYINLKRPDLGNFPPMAFRYNFYVGSNVVYSGFTPIATQNSLLSWVDGNGNQFYTMVYYLEYDCSAFCPESPYENAFPFTLEYQLMEVQSENSTSVVSPYPIRDYSDIHGLWPTSFFEMPPAPGTAPINSEMKYVCCWKKKVLPIVMNGDGNTISTGSAERQGLEGKDGLQNIGSSEAETPNAFNVVQNMGNSLTIQPNPFQSVLGVKFKVEKPGLVRFECLDVQGKPVKSFVPFNAASGIHSSSFDMDDVPPGLYFLRMLSEDGVSVVKIVRS